LIRAGGSLLTVDSCKKTAMIPLRAAVPDGAHLQQRLPARPGLRQFPRRRPPIAVLPAGPVKQPWPPWTS